MIEKRLVVYIFALLLAIIIPCCLVWSVDNQNNARPIIQEQRVYVTVPPANTYTPLPTYTPYPTLTSLPTEIPTKILTILPTLTPTIVEVTGIPTTIVVIIPPTIKPLPTKIPAKIATIRIGAVCKDGSRSKSTGKGACSHHGGVAQWLYR